MPLIKTADRHAVRVKSAIIGANDKGTPFVEFEFINPASETLNGWLYLSDAAFERSVRVLRDVFGFDNDFTTLPAQVTDKECSITTEFETFEGKERLKVKWINSVGRDVAPVDVSALSKFSARAARIAAEPAKAASGATKAADGDFPTA